MKRYKEAEELSAFLT